jgi:hypothetical protein
LSCGCFDQHFGMGLSRRPVVDPGMPPAPIVQFHDRTPTVPRSATAPWSLAMVAYAWHPWAGKTGRVREVIERAGGRVMRSALEDAGIGRDQEIPAWMLDAAFCRMMRAVTDPVADLRALGALQALLAEVTVNHLGPASKANDTGLSRTEPRRSPWYAAATGPGYQPVNPTSSIGSVSFRGKFAADRALTTRSCIMRQRSGPAAQPRAERGWSAGAPAKHFG